MTTLFYMVVSSEHLYVSCTTLAALLTHVCISRISVLEQTVHHRYKVGSSNAICIWLQQKYICVFLDISIHFTETLT